MLTTIELDLHTTELIYLMFLRWISIKYLTFFFSLSHSFCTPKVLKDLVHGRNENMGFYMSDPQPESSSFQYSGYIRII